jgi:nucleotide-binding universal stress UspA family protein
MKAILVPVEPHPAIASVLDAALVVARRFGGTIEGFALRPAPVEYVPIDMIGGLAWHVDERADRNAAADARALFERHMADREVPRAGGEAPGFRWYDEAPAGDAFAGSRARVFDLTVLGRPDTDPGAPRLSTLETVLFESGRPILIAPRSVPTSLGETIVIAWNGSTETARAAAFAMPFLREAGRVVVLTVEGGSVPGPTGEEMSRSLRLNGIAAEPMRVKSDRRSAGEAFLATAASLGCDLLVKGAYTQSRLRQMIFGGATSHILAAATVPVLMAH